MQIAATERDMKRGVQKIAAVMLATLLLASCATSFTYNRLDWLIPWYVDSYVDLTRAQRQALQAELEPRLALHREEELARYVTILNGIEADLKRPVNAATIRRWVEEAVAAAQRVERSMMEVVLAFRSEVSDDQVNEFMHSLWQRQREFEEEFLDRNDAEYADDNIENLSSLLERFLGRLSRQQHGYVSEAAESLQRFDHAWLEERRGWLNSLEPLLRARDTDWQTAVMRAYEAHLRDRTPGYYATFDHNLDQMANAYARALSIMSARQYERAFSEVEDLRRTLYKLMDLPKTAQSGHPIPANPFTSVSSSPGSCSSKRSGYIISWKCIRPLLLAQTSAPFPGNVRIVDISMH